MTFCCWCLGVMDSRVVLHPTIPSFGHPTVYFYPTVSPRVVVVPILSCIIGFPLLVLLVICGLRYRARRARISAKKAHSVESSVLELTSGPSILASRYSNGKSHRQKRKKALVRFKPMPEIDLDTVVEEKSEFDAEVTASDLLTTPDELIVPEETSFPASFRAYRYMGPVQQAILSPIKTSPYRTPPHGATNLEHVSEEMNVEEDEMMGNSDDERLDDFDEDDGDSVDAAETGSVDDLNDDDDDDDDDGEAPTSGGSSDSETVNACFSLSPKQVNKSPTGVHLALKKLDGAVKRRNSSPVKVNYCKSKGQRSSGKVNHSYASDEDSPQPIRVGFDYIDRELMPEISPRTRSHSVKHPSRRAASFTIKKRHGESLKLRSKSFSRSMSHGQDGQEHRPRVHQRGPHSGEQLHNGVLECDVHAVSENSGLESSTGEQISSNRSSGDGMSSKTVSETDIFPNGNETYCSRSLRDPHSSGSFRDLRPSGSFRDPRPSGSYRDLRPSGSFREPRPSGSFRDTNTLGISRDPHRTGSFRDPQSSKSSRDPYRSRSFRDSHTSRSFRDSQTSGSCEESHASDRGGCTHLLKDDRDASESPMKRLLPQSLRTVYGETLDARELYQVPPIITEESAVECQQENRAMSPPSTLDVTFANESALKDPDNEAGQQCHRCLDKSERDNERSTLV
ncbi:dentin sialophosphoprotein [Procambarus clarkii]|uniref:dentin sialophosphoprotein n=1 Tax=Procambarus clarkii TaxID=6728 RepID=UPI001E6758B9|nr:eisosome protein SEG2-like [Procambarus clarkii]XP_045621274.1 eisosome protein SEG2-like [Procambarus clarkii]XP_045621275.1 eisosome protein SEG2-like [Procambarus clarkii]XP_045621276.1 eisosome protein SEG2-like [Procambarus clarkii]